MNFEIKTNLKITDADHEMQRERNSVMSVVNLSGRANLFPGVYVLIYPVQIVFSVSIMVSVFNESFSMYLRHLISKTWHENL